MKSNETSSPPGLSRGARVGGYEIVEPIGVGGMGEVFRARDPRLNRDVAIKVLPAAFAGDSERVARFRREAQVVAALHHPNIAAIYGLEEAGGMLALALEFVDGEDLAQRLARGPIAVDEAIAIATQIAEGLEAAHEKGIVHRDLKPANIKLTSDGRVKILDFGLARAFDDDAASSGASLANSPTIARPMTDAGMILGTAAYMSPEQARGKPVDKRSDIWSFGVVLYEMLTAKRLFQGETVSDTLAAVLRQDVDLRALPDGTPPSVIRLLTRCLERNPRNRLHDIADARLDLSMTEPETAAVVARAPLRRTASSWWGWAVAAAFLLVSATLATLFVRVSSREQAEAQRISRFQFVPAKGERLAVSDLANMRPFAVSPDGTQIVYVVEKDATTELRVRPFASSTSTPMAGTEGATNPFFSPDGKWVGFAATGKLKKVALAGGTPLTLADAPGFRGAVWADDGSIYYVPDLYVPISRIGSEGGASRPATTIQRSQGELQHRWPEVVPGSRVLLYTVGYGADWDDAAIVAQRLDTGERQVLVKGGTSPRYLDGGELVYARGGSLYAVAFDARTLKVSGSPVEVARDVFLDPRGLAFIDVARTGLLVSAPLDSMGGRSILSWVDRDGHSDPLRLAPMNFGSVLLSPQGDRAAVTIGNAVGIVDVNRMAVTRLNVTRRAENPVWSRDGRRIYFGYEQGKSYQIHSKAADDSSEPRLVAPSDFQEDPYSLSPDGSRLLAMRNTAGSSRELVIHELGPTPGAARVLLSSPSLQSSNAVFSPNGRWVAYETDESGIPEIYVRPASGEDRKWQISVNGGRFPVWSPAGNEIFFLAGPRLLAAPVSEKGDEIVAAQPTVLFGNHRLLAFDAAHDAKRFFVAEDANPSDRVALDVVVHWAADVRRRLEDAGRP